MSEPVLIGYFPKHRTPRPEWLPVPHVEEICSVSGCIARQPADWIDSWTHNDWSAYDTPELARAVAEEGCDLYAWRILPTLFGREAEQPLTLTGVAPSALPTDFERLGWDVVSRSGLGILGFECSPLSCNRMASQEAVNRYCLLDSEADAVAFARRCAVEQPEPGDYLVIEVWRAS